MYTITFTQEYLEMFLKVTFNSFLGNNVVETPYKWKNQSY